MYLETDPWSSRSPSKYRVKFMSLHYMSFENPQLLCGCRPNPLRFWVGMAPCLLVFLAEGFPNRVADLKRGIQPAKGVMNSQGFYVEIEIAKHHNRKQLRKKIPDTNNKTRTYWSSSSLYIYLSRFYFTMMISILHYIKWSNRFLISWSRISATILTLTPESFQYLLATCHACQQLLTFFLPKRENYWIHFCLPEVFAVKQHSKEMWNTFG